MRPLFILAVAACSGGVLSPVDIAAPAGGDEAAARVGDGAMPQPPSTVRLVALGDGGEGNTAQYQGAAVV